MKTKAINILARHFNKCSIEYYMDLFSKMLPTWKHLYGSDYIAADQLLDHCNLLDKKKKPIYDDGIFRGYNVYFKLKDEIDYTAHKLYDDQIPTLFDLQWESKNEKPLEKKLILQPKILTLNDFIKSKTIISTENYKNYYGYAESESTFLFLYDHTVYINVLDDNSGYYLMLERSDYQGPNLSKLETLLWDWYKHENMLTEAEIKNDLILRENELLNKMNSKLTLAESITQDITDIEHKRQAIYLSNQFQKL